MNKIKIEAQDNQRLSVPQSSKIKIEVITSPTCPHCPHAKNAVNKFAKDNEYIKVVEYSTATHEGRKKSQQLDVRSVPTLFISGPGSADRIGFVGSPSQNQLKKMVGIAKGEDNWPKEEGLFEKLAKKLKIKIKI
ncbi:hypothetical protein HN789_01825 [archaeon]|jgi:glutaredoxin|nr:hypothetical protein [archaeon]MBT4022553.1 hypothetical protein [archaeon]MBT4272879.1 hypothetical protein [archaeon]MBT4461679.1 hypothetical protein [archaeon]MBT4857553.1 hypothetical protein [archaeon]